MATDINQLIKASLNTPLTSGTSPSVLIRESLGSITPSAPTQAPITKYAQNVAEGKRRLDISSTPAAKPTPFIAPPAGQITSYRMPQFIKLGEIGKAVNEKKALDKVALNTLNQRRIALKQPTLKTLPTPIKEEIKLQNANNTTYAPYVELLKKIKFTKPTTALDKYVTKPITEIPKTSNQLMEEHFEKYEKEPLYRNEFDTQMRQGIADKMVQDKEGTGLGRLANDIMAFEGNFIDGITQGAFSSGLIKDLGGYRPLGIPDYKQTLKSLSSVSPYAAGAANLIGSLVSQIAIQGMTIKGIQSGMALSKVSLNAQRLFDLNKIGIGLATQIPQSFFQRDSYKQLVEQKGDIAIEIARNGFSWYVGGNFERFMDNALGKIITNPVIATGIKKNLFASVVSKAPMLYRATTEIAETIGQMVGDIALGRTEWLTDPSFAVQNFGMDLLVLTVSGLMGVDGSNKAAILKEMKLIRKNFDLVTSKPDAPDFDLTTVRAQTINAIDAMIRKYDVQNLQLKQTGDLVKHIMTYDKRTIESEFGTLVDAGNLSKVEEDTNILLAEEQTTKLAGTKDTSTLAAETKNAMADNPPRATTADNIKDDVFKQYAVKPEVQDFADAVKDMFGVDIMFSAYSNPVNSLSYHGMYNPDNNTITINAKSIEALDAVIMHEVIHSMKATNPDAYNGMIKAIRGYVQESPELQHRVTEFLKEFPKKSTEGIQEEYIGDYVMALTKVGGAKFWDGVLKKESKGIVKMASDFKKTLAVMRSKNYKDNVVLKGVNEVAKITSEIENALIRFKTEPKIVPVKAEIPVVKAEAKPAAVKPVAPVKAAVAGAPIALKAEGSTGKLILSDKSEVTFKYAIVDMDSLIASNDVNGVINPDYPPELQPRDRERGASVASIAEESARLNPELLTDSKTPTDGAMIIGEDGVIESGNGRYLMIEAARQRHKSAYIKYIQYIKSNAAKFGLDPESVGNKSVLVRVRTSDVDRVKFAQQSNVSQMADMSTTERAKIDSSKVTSGLISRLVADDINQLLLVRNNEFVTEFVNRVIPPTERGNMMTSDGTLSKTGLDRIKNAIFMKAYDSTDLVERLSELATDDAKSITKALLTVSPKAIEVSEAIKAGDMYPLDFSKDFANAADIYVKSKGSKKQLEGQVGLFDTEKIKSNELINDVFELQSKNASALSKFMDTAYDTVKNLGDPKQVTLFGDTKIPSKEDIIYAVTEKLNTEKLESAGLGTGRPVKVPEAGQQGITKTPPVAKKKAVKKDLGIKFSQPEINLGFHAGDLGKAESLLNMSGGRSTGHFGTGTYFLSSDTELKALSGYKERPQRAINFDGYNLYKPKSFLDATELHDALKFVNNKIAFDYAEIKGTDNLDTYYRKADEALSNWEQTITDSNPLGDNVKRNELKSILSRFANEQKLNKADSDNKAWRVYEDTLKDVKDRIGRVNNNRSDYVGQVDSLTKLLKTDKNKIISTIDGIMKEYQPLFEKGYQAIPKKFDSISTALMKKLGYEGVDVRGIKEMDNTKYGSVIYDVKPESIKYSEPTAKKLPLPADKYQQTLPTTLKSTRIPVEAKNALVDISEDFKKSFVSSKALGEDFKKQLATGGDVTASSLKSQWDSVVYSEKLPSSSDIAKAVELVAYYADANKIDDMEDVLSGLANILSETGRNLQAMKLINALTPMGYVKTMQKALNKLNKMGQNKYGGKWTDFELTPDEIKLITNTDMSDAFARDVIRAKIGARIVNEIPTNAIDVLTAWRKLSMLSSARTHMRNVLSNVAYMPIRKFDNAIGTAIEKMFVKNPEARSHALFAGKDLYKIADKDYIDNVKGTLKNLDKDIANTRSVFGVEVKAFGNKTQLAKLMNKASEFNRYMMNDVEDVPFYGFAYKSALANYMKANKMVEVTDAARLYSIDKALEATYKQTNKLINWIEAGKKNKAIMGTAIDVAIPFVRTPINIVMRGIEHSPAGLVTSLVKATKYLRGDTTSFVTKGGVTKTRGDVELLRGAVDDMSATLTGSAIIGLGATLFNWGFVTAPPEDDYKLAEYKRQVGEAPYALRVGNKYIPLNWIQPTAIPLLTGVSIADKIVKEGYNFTGFTKGMISGLDVVFELPFLKGVQDLLGGSSTSTTGTLTTALQTFTSSYANQMLPTLLGDIGKAVVPTVKTTWTPREGSAEDKELAGKFPYFMRDFARDALVKLAPGLLEDKINIWGQPVQRTETTAGRVIQSFISPFNTTTGNVTPVDTELMRLVKVDPNNKRLYPNLPPLYISNKGEKINLTPKDYTLWAKTSGQTSFNALNKLISGKDYRGLDDIGKAKAFEQVYSYAAKKANADVLIKNNVSKLTFSSEYDKVSNSLIEVYSANYKENPDISTISFPRTVTTDELTYRNRKFAMTDTQKQSYEALYNKTVAKAISDITSGRNYSLYNAKKRYDLIQDAISDARERATITFIRDNYVKK